MYQITRLHGDADREGDHPCPPEAEGARPGEGHRVFRPTPGHLPLRPGQVGLRDSTVLGPQIPPVYAYHHLGRSFRGHPCRRLSTLERRVSDLQNQLSKNRRAARTCIFSHVTNTALCRSKSCGTENHLFRSAGGGGSPISTSRGSLASRLGGYSCWFNFSVRGFATWLLTRLIHISP